VSAPPAGAEGGFGACCEVDETPIFEVDEGHFDGHSTKKLREVEDTTDEFVEFGCACLFFEGVVAEVNGKDDARAGAGGSGPCSAE